MLISITLATSIGIVSAPEALSHDAIRDVDVQNAARATTHTTASNQGRGAADGGAGGAAPAASAARPAGVTGARGQDAGGAMTGAAGARGQDAGGAMTSAAGARAEPAWVGSLHRGFSYAQLEAGFGYINLQSLRVGENLWPGVAQASIFAPVVGFQGGVRLWFIELGVGYHALLNSAVSFSTTGIHVGCRVPVGRVEPHFSVQTGIASVVQAANTVLNPSAQLDLRGYHFGLRFGADYYFFRVFSAGFAVDSRLFGVSGPEFGDMNAPIARNLDGMSLGIVISGLGVVSLHL